MAPFPNDRGKTFLTLKAARPGRKEEAIATSTVEDGTL